MRTWLVGVCAALAACAGTVTAESVQERHAVYVNNKTGSDAFNGAAAEPAADGKEGLI
jgi:ABC-type oligopeptide transport system substrate-binding subunit